MLKLVVVGIAVESKTSVEDPLDVVPGSVVVGF